jgi:hypothetical protein
MVELNKRIKTEAIWSIETKIEAEVKPIKIQNPRLDYSDAERIGGVVFFDGYIIM